MYKPGKYKDKSVKEIKKEVISEGFDPLVISDPPGRIYSKHTHPETKLLAILEGEMEVKTGGKTITLNEGDELIIPGKEEHSAVVGTDGCKFFWSEIILNSN